MHANKPESNTIRIVSYNVENLFDYRHDTLKNDFAFLPEGQYRWTKTKFHNKLHKIAQVICNIGDTLLPAIIGLQEVENDSCLYRLCHNHLGSHFFSYAYLHYESPDLRGIDVALLYDTTLFRPLSAYPIPIPFDSTVRPTRDILYAHLLNTSRITQMSEHTPLAGNDRSSFSLHCFVCHFPSQLGGAANTKKRRQQVEQTLINHIDSLLSIDPDAKIIVMGDFNGEPRDCLPPLINLMNSGNNSMYERSETFSTMKYAPSNRKHYYTYKFRDIWSCIDQFFVSPSLLYLITDTRVYSPEWLLEKDERYLGYKPFRTFVGPRFNGGYSDHLPIILDIKPSTK